ncbi:MAG: hypothetical protein QOK48_94 [Blastocatellia bacterium]|nr:hypothetical protein [Blastocatellia bacterium]
MFQSFQTPVYAGFWLRFAAYLIDSILLALVTLPVGFALGVIMATTGVDSDPSITMSVNLLINGASILLGWLYSSLLESSSWQGTVGKKVVGLRVTDLDGNRISFGKATGRYFGKILSGMICLVGFFMAAFTEKRQALHDMLANTLVLSGPPIVVQYVPPPPPDFGYGTR